MKKLLVIAYFILLIPAFYSLNFEGASAQSFNCVTDAGCNAQFITQSVPTTMVAGQPSAVSVTMLNNGAVDWTCCQFGTDINANVGYKLGDQRDVGSPFTPVRVAVPGTITPGQTATFNFNLTPNAPGTYVFSMRMVCEFCQWFGESTPSVTVTVLPPPPPPTPTPVPLNLGTHWCETEFISNPFPFKGIWVRRGSTNTFDASFTRSGFGTFVTATLNMSGGNGVVTILRTGGSDGKDCTYNGTTSDGTNFSGTYVCTGNGQDSWTAVVNGNCFGPPTCSASFSPATVNAGQSSTLTWSSNFDADEALQYSCTGNIGSGTTTTSGSISVNPTSNQTCTFTVINTTNNTGTCSAPITVIPPPADYIVQGLASSPGNIVAGQQVSFSATVLNSGAGSGLAVSSTRARLDINNNGTFDQTFTNQSTSALAAGANEVETWSSVWTAVTGTHAFEICADIGSNVTESNEANNCSTQIFTVAPPALSVNILCNGANACSIGFNTSANLSWTSANATSCSVSPGGWTGTSNASQATPNLVTTTTYTLTCNGPAGTATDNVVVTVGAPPAPAASITCNSLATSCSIGFDTSANIAWTSSNTTSCTVTPGSGTGLNGSFATPNLRSNQVYNLSCTGSGGTATSTVSVNVNPPPAVSASITCNNLGTSCLVANGGTASINWTCTNATSGAVSNTENATVWAGISGGQTVPNITTTRTYTLNCTGVGGSSTARVVVNAGAAVMASPTPGPVSIDFEFEIPNPFDGGISTLEDLFNIILAFLYYIAGPIAVILIIIAGLFFLFGRGQPDKVNTGKKILTYALIGFSIILIGRGFIALIESILALGS